MAMDSDANLCSDSSSSDGAEDFEQMSVQRQAKYEAWKVRELRRILRDRDEME